MQEALAWMVHMQLSRAWNDWRMHAAEQQQRTRKLWFAVLRVIESKEICSICKSNDAGRTCLDGAQAPELRMEHLGSACI